MKSDGESRGRMIYQFLGGSEWTSCILKTGEACLAPTWNWRAKNFSPLHTVGQTGLHSSAFICVHLRILLAACQPASQAPTHSLAT